MININYLLVTPVRDEAKNLPQLIDSVINQTIKPVLWLIINDNSQDNSLNIIKEASSNYSFIEFDNLEPAPYDLAWRYHRIMSEGFNKAIEICESRNIVWNYLGVLDGDIVFKESDYYEFLITEFNQNEKLGIASGGTMSFNGSTFIREGTVKDKPNGAARLIKRECFDKIKYPIVPAADSVMNILANKYGYETKRFELRSAYQSRMTATGQGEFKGGCYEGKVKYFLGYSLSYAALNFLKLIFTFRFKKSAGFIFTYVYLLLTKKERVKDNFVFNYYNNKLAEVFKRTL